MATLEDKAAEPRPPVIEPGHTFATVTDQISAIVLSRPTSRGWWLGFAVSFFLLQLLNLSITMLLVYGVGVLLVNLAVDVTLALLDPRSTIRES